MEGALRLDCEEGNVFKLLNFPIVQNYLSQATNKEWNNLIDTLGKGYNAFNKSNFSSLGLNHNKVTQKSRVMTLAIIHKSGAGLPFKSIASELEVSEAEIEDWLIESILNGQVDGRIDQSQDLLIFEEERKVNKDM